MTHKHSINTFAYFIWTTYDVYN